VSPLNSVGRHSEQFKEGTIGTKDKNDCCLPLLAVDISETKTLNVFEQSEGVK